MLFQGLALGPTFRLYAFARGGAAGCAEQTMFAVMAANPDVVLCDSLSDAVSSPRIIPELRRNLPNLKVLMFGMECDEEEFLIAVEQGVCGYILKNASASEVAAIRAVASGDAVCPPKLCRVLFNHVAGLRAWKPSAQVTKKLDLTRREQQLVQLISMGLTNKEIASRLSLPEQTVKNHLRRMFRKSGATDRLEAVEYRRTQGFWT